MSHKSATQRADGMLLTVLELVTEGVKDVLDEQKAFDLGTQVVDKIRQTFSGELVYISKGRSINSIIVCSEIWNDFKGDNHLELSKKYDCTVQWVYRAVKMMQKIKTAEVQGDMFDDGDASDLSQK